MRKITKFCLEVLAVNIVLSFVVVLAIWFVQVNNLQFYDGSLTAYNILKVDLGLICVVINLQFVNRFLGHDYSDKRCS